MVTEVKVRCSKSVYSDRIGGRPCGRRATVERDGKPYCAQHDPVAVKRRREEARVKWEAKQVEWRQVRDEAAEQKRRAEAYPRLLAALKALVAFDATYGILEDLQAHNAAMATARTLIAEIEAQTWGQWMIGKNLSDKCPKCGVTVAKHPPRGCRAAEIEATAAPAPEAR